MRRLTSIALTTLFFSFALVGTVLAAEKGTKTETPKEEQVTEQTLDDKGPLAEKLDTEKASWSNVKALWGENK